MSNENIAYTIVGCVVIIVVIMLAISIFNNQTITGHTVYDSELSIKSSSLTIYNNYTFTINCESMDMPNIVLYFNGYTINDYKKVYDKDVWYKYNYDCSIQKLYLEVYSEEYILVGIDLKIGQ